MYPYRRKIEQSGIIMKVWLLLGQVSATGAGLLYGTRENVLCQTSYSVRPPTQSLAHMCFDAIILLLLVTCLRLIQIRVATADGNPHNDLTELLCRIPCLSQPASFTQPWDRRLASLPRV